MRIVRLGQGVDRTGRFADEALGRVFAAVEEYASVIGAHDVEAVRFVATSAARDAGNGEAFLAGVTSRLGVSPEIISGDEEARLSFDGATRDLPAVAEPIAVVDIGGGSTELVLGVPGQVRAARSLDVGSVRLTERLMPSDPPSAQELDAATRTVEEALDTLPSYGVELAGAPTLVGVAGTVTTLGMLLVGLDHWDRERVHRSSFPAPQVHDLVARLLALPVAEREALGVPRGRSDVVGAGALILDRVLRRSGAERLTVSDADILDGIAWSLVAARGPSA
jgi:exopolyphosphatase/guanosine-5'-triphosphate,3'-diphosphate pyrophosphatase